MDLGCAVYSLNVEKHLQEGRAATGGDVRVALARDAAERQGPRGPGLRGVSARRIAFFAKHLRESTNSATFILKKISQPARGLADIFRDAS